ncbi:MAG TPA: phosphoribosylformylglycinamidine synthase subunit PurQ [Alphaproteobacteria bacterium]|nr:phosphoribosylformylglycinamidine synthase subunit PurQ [Alphaproteobacteria bacterium]
MSAKVLVLAGYGLNCEEETLHGFEHAGLSGQIRHINDLIENPKELETAEILAIPGGFSYGDDTGAGNAYAQKLKLALWEPLQKFIARDTLAIGICNGCQILTNLGLNPPTGTPYGERKIAVTYNETARYQCRWIDLKITSSSPWLSGIEHMHLPVAHGEGRFMMDEGTLKTLQNNSQIAAQYIKPGGTPANGEFPYNPNGSLSDIAAITDETERILTIMPHPERGMFTSQRDDYMQIKDAARRKGQAVNETADGMALFTNAARYFEIAQKKSA